MDKEKKILRECIRRALIETILENLNPIYLKQLDAVSDDLQACLKSLEAAHQAAPDPVSKTILMGVHSDLFNAAASARNYLTKLKTGKVSAEDFD